MVRFTLVRGGTPSTVCWQGAAPAPWCDVRSALDLDASLGWSVCWPPGAPAVMLGEQDRIGLPPLVQGCVVSDTTSHRRIPPRAGSPVRLQVVAGPDAGRTVDLPAGQRLSLGRAESNDVVIDDPGLSRHHLVVWTDRGGVQITDPGSTNGILLGDTPVTGPSPWLPDQAVVVGNTRLALAEARAGPAPTPGLAAPGSVAPGPLATDEALTVPIRHRPLPEPVPQEFGMPSPPTTQRPPRPPMLAWMIPLAVSALLAVVLSTPSLVLFGLMAPALTLGNHLGERRSHRRESAAAQAAHRQESAAILSRARTALQAETRLRTARAPDLANLIEQALTAAGPVRAAPEPLLWSVPPEDGTVRVGTADLPSDVLLDGTRLTARAVPLEADVAGGVGIVGPPSLTRALARSLLTQLIVRHDPASMRVRITAPLRADPAWDWLAWAPHTDTEQPGSEPPGAGQPGSHHGDAGCTVLVHDVSAAPAPIRPGPAAWTLLLGESVEQVGAAATVVEVSAADRILLTRLDDGTPGARVQEGRPDLLGVALAEQVTRALSPLRVAGAGESADGPAPADFLALHPGTRADDLARQWTRQPRSTTFTLGAGADGPVCIDLVQDGPHALVGGTTGSGKSELLRTLVTSLALANRPDELVFVLVDYKGGSAFGDADGLPHTRGVITDLDPNLADRALTSLTAELKRRERILAEAGARDLPAYQRLGGVPRLPRLVLVIDEFRALAEELPGFVDGLVRIAALGRSLGVHLVLATQRPAGIVSADVRANVNLRIALRMRDSSDSYDVIDCGDAAALPARAPGRALLRTGAAAPRQVQVARVSLPPRPVEASSSRVHLLDSPWGQPPQPAEPEEAEQDGPSLLAQICRTTQAAAERLGCEEVPSPWLPVLPHHVRVADLGDRDGDTSGGAGVPVALLDLPAQQRQVGHTWDPVTDGHLAVVGATRTGRTSAVRTVLGGLAASVGPDQLHLYGFDLGGGAGPVAELPHTGAWVGTDEVRRGLRVLELLHGVLARRQRQLAARGVTSLEELRRTGDRSMPVLCLVVDGWATFVEVYGEADRGRGVEWLLSLLRDGPSVGLAAVLTGDRSLLTSRAAALVPQTWALRMTDPSDLMVAGLSRRQVPERMPPGRMVRLGDGVVAQAATVGAEPDGAAQVAWLARLAASAGGRLPPSAGGPLVVAALPRRVTLAGRPTDPADPCARADEAPALTFGVGGDDGRWVSLPQHTSSFLVAGPPGSGRSTVLATLAAEAERLGHAVVFVTDRTPPEQLRDSLAASGPAAVVLVDDVSRLTDSPAEDILLGWAAGRAHASAGQSGGLLVVAGDTDQLGNAFRGLVPVVARARCGLLLNPAGPADGAVLGVTVGAPDEPIPGRGLLVWRGAATPVQVAVPPGPPTPAGAS